MLVISLLLRGLVYVPSLAIYILIALLLLFVLRLKLVKLLHHRFLILANSCFAGLICISLLHFLMPENGALWLSQSTSAQRFAGSFDLSGEYGALGRIFFLAIVLWISMLIGQSRRLSMLFLQSFLAFSIASTIITFLMITPQRFSSGFSYHHGLVNPNHGAHFLGIILLLTTWQSHRWLRQFRSQPHWRRFIKWLDGVEIKHLAQGIFMLFSMLLLLVCLLLTHSRGGLAACIIAMLCFGLMLASKYLLKHKPHQNLFIWLVPAALAALTIIFLVSPYGSLFDQRFKQEGLGLADRPTLYVNALQLIKERPLLGHGAGQFEPAYRLQRKPAASSEGIIEAAHSNYLEIAIEYGLVGLALLLLPCFYAAFTLARAFLDHRERYGLPALGLSLWILSALHSLFDFPLQIPALAAIQIALITICLCQSNSYRRKLTSAAHTSHAPAPA